MSEEKVWVEKLPEYCDDCPCSLRDKDDCAYCNLLHKNIGYDFGKRPKHCPLQLIKDHDRELVKEVCEKIRTMAHKVGKLVFCEHCYKTNSARAIDEHLLNEILGQIESEFEQKEYEK